MATPTMSASVLAGIAVGGAGGAVARYLVSAAAGRFGAGWPWGTFAVNALGCVAIGALLALAMTPEGAPRWDPTAAVRAAVFVGFLGAFTTFSTYAWEAVDLAMRGHAWRATGYILLSHVVGLAAVWGGWKLASGGISFG